MLLVLASSLARAQGAAQSWTVGVTARETYTDNGFLSSFSGPVDLISGSTVSLSFGRVRPTTSFALQAWVSPSFTGGVGFNSRFRFGLGGTVQRRLSDRARLRFGASYASGLNPEALFATQIDLPQVDVKSLSGEVGIDYQLGRYTTIGASVDSFWTRYRSSLTFDSGKLPSEALVPPDILVPLEHQTQSKLPVAPDNTLQTLGLLAAEELTASRLDYWSVGGRAKLAHEFSPQTSVTAVLGYRRGGDASASFGRRDQFYGQFALAQALGSTLRLSFSYSEEESLGLTQYHTHSLSVRADKALNRWLRLDASVGGSYLDGPNGPSSGFTIIGGAGVSASGKRTSFAARYDRSRYQTLVTGANYTSDSVYASLGQKLGGKVFLSVYGYYRSAGDALGLSSYGASLVGSSLGMPISRRCSTGAIFAYQRFERTPGGEAHRSIASVFVRYLLGGR